MRGDARPTVVSLFTGAGGLDVGLEQAGFLTVAAAECNEDCVATLVGNREAKIPIPGLGRRRYLEHMTIVPRYVEQINPEDLRPAGVGSRWTPDLMAGGPPCQPFSSSGDLRSVTDPRGRLFEYFVRLAGLLQPRLILFENVRGLVTVRGLRGEPGEALFMVKQAFEGIGYATRFALLNAADYGCPQRRVRCFMMAARDVAVPPFPEPTHAEHPEPSLFDPRRPWVCLRDFLASQPEPAPADVVRPSATLAVQLQALSEGTGLRMRGQGNHPARRSLGVQAGDLHRRFVAARANRHRLGEPGLGSPSGRGVPTLNLAGVCGPAGVSRSVAVCRRPGQSVPANRQRRACGFWRGARSVLAASPVGAAWQAKACFRPLTCRVRHRHQLHQERTASEWHSRTG